MEGGRKELGSQKRPPPQDKVLCSSKPLVRRLCSKLFFPWSYKYLGEPAGAGLELRQEYTVGQDKFFPLGDISALRVKAGFTSEWTHSKMAT